MKKLNLTRETLRIISASRQAQVAGGESEGSVCLCQTYEDCGGSLNGPCTSCDYACTDRCTWRQIMK
jgi:hypothetical protein